MNLDELKQLAEVDEEIDQRPQTIFCEVCDCRRQQIVITYRQLQIRSCEGMKGRGHTMYFDPLGKYLWANELHDGTVDWRERIDHARTEGVKPQTMAWDRDKDGALLRPRRKGGRGKKGGSGYTSYVEDDE